MAIKSKTFLESVREVTTPEQRQRMSEYSVASHAKNSAVLSEAIDFLRSVAPELTEKQKQDAGWIAGLLDEMRLKEGGVGAVSMYLASPDLGVGSRKAIKEWKRLRDEAAEKLRAERAVA